MYTRGFSWQLSSTNKLRLRCNKNKKQLTHKEQRLVYGWRREAAAHSRNKLFRIRFYSNRSYC